MQCLTYNLDDFEVKFVLMYRETYLKRIMQILNGIET